MREIGTALRLARSGMLIVKLTSEPKPGQLLVDSRGKSLGKVTEVFGPVKFPYASVRPWDQLTSKVVGEKVYSRSETGN